MGSSKRVPSFHDLSPAYSRECSDETPFATPMATPSEYAQHCRSASPPPKQVPGSFGDWEMHHLESQHHPVQTGTLPSPRSPSESENSLSAFSTIGSSSSSSSFFNDTCSYSGAGDLSPSSVGSREPKSAMVSPVRLSFQDMQMGSKLHTLGYRTIAHPTPQKPEIRGGGLHDGLLDYCFQKGRVVERHGGNAFLDGNSACMSSPHLQSDDRECESRGRQQRASVVREKDPIIKNPISKVPGYSSTGLDQYQMVVGEAVVPSKEPALATCLSEACDAHHYLGDETILYSMPTWSHQFKQATRCELETEHEKIQSQDGVHNGGLWEHPAKVKRGLLKASDKSGKRPNTCMDSCTSVFHDSHEYLNCGLSPEIGMDIAASLKGLPDLITPCKEVSLSRALSLHQSPYTYGRPPLIPPPKLNNTPCSPGGSNKEVSQRRSFTVFSSDAIGSPGRHIKGRQVKHDDNEGPLNPRGFSRSSSTIYTKEVTGEIAEGLFVWPPRIGYAQNTIAEHAGVSSFLPLVCQNLDKRDGLTHSDRSRGWQSVTESPTIFSSESHRDWRSKSLGGKASLKSTARNLEAAFSSYRSASLHNSTSCISKGVSKGAAPLSDSESMNIVSVSSMDSHKHEPCRLNSSNMDVDRKGQCSADMVLCRAPYSRKILSIDTYSSIACTPKHLVIKPLAPMTHKQRRPKFELLCKPLLPVAQSIYQLPSSKVALNSAKPCSSGYALQGLSMDASKIVSPSMSQAYVQYTVMDGVSCYTLTMEGAEAMLMAKDCRPETPPSTGRPKWLYTFYSGKTAGKGPKAGGWRRWTKREKKAPLDVSAIMQVSSLHVPDILVGGIEKEDSLALEFVLYDGKEHAATHSQSLRICPTDMYKSLSTEGMWSSSHCALPSRFSHSGSVEKECTSLSMASGASPIRGSGNIRATTTPLKRGPARHKPTYSLDGWSDSDLPDSNSHTHDSSLPSHMELAAIVIKVHMKSHQNMLNVMHGVDTMGGWGLKFLNGGRDLEVDGGVSHRASLHATSKETSASAQGLHAQKKPLADKSSTYVRSHEAESTRVMENQKIDFLDMAVCVAPVEQNNPHHEKTGSSECLTLILPKGEHSLPSAGARRPSSLIERWQSGGSCECGGWDLGCGIEVLSAGELKTNPTSHTRTTSVISPGQPISMYSQGSRKELMFSLYPVKQGQYKLRFQEKLSALRAFATTVAILHGCHIGLTSPTCTATSTSVSTSSSSASPFSDTH